MGRATLRARPLASRLRGRAALRVASRRPRRDLVRIYRTLYLEVPRKNGKSTLAAVIALYLLTHDREAGAEVVSAAADREQARAVYDVAAEDGEGVAGSSSEAMPGQPRRDRRPRARAPKVLAADAFRQHGLNLHGAVIDELHVHKNREIVEVLETSTGSRTQPLVAIITTAGLDDPGSIYTERRDYAEKVARELWTTELVDPDDPERGLRSARPSPASRTTRAPRR
jgi:phage terminase large subunit-like protein